jgi:hypothetical protein
MDLNHPVLFKMAPNNCYFKIYNVTLLFRTGSEGE